MRQLTLLSAFLLACAVSTFAQTGRTPSLDNFDLPNGVRIEDIPKTGVLPSKKVRLTSLSAPSVPNARLRRDDHQTRALSMAVGKSLEGFTTGNATIDALIIESGTRNGVDPVLLYAIMHRESSFKQHAVSYKGARGLMQLMPGTAARFGVTNIFEPRQNIEGGTRYMRFLLDFFGGDVRLALAGYNAGEGAVLKYGRRVPPYRETQEYVRRIGERYELMRNPETVRRAARVTPRQIVRIEKETPAVATLYERDVYAVRLPDGKLQLVSH